MNRVYDALDKTRFSSAAFDIHFPESGELQLVVKLPSTNYFFSWTIQDVVRYKPGRDVLDYATAGVPFDLALNHLSNWVGFVHDEMSVVLPHEFGTDDIFNLIEKFSKNQNPENAAARFTFDEVADLTKKLEELEEKLNVLVGKHQLTEESLIALREVISNAKEDLPNLPQQVWYRTAAAKIYTTTRQIIISKEGRTLAYEGAKKMLGLE